MDDLIYRPCKTCGAVDYNNLAGDDDEFNELPDGRMEVHPKKCDKCDLVLMMSESSALH